MAPLSHIWKFVTNIVYTVTLSPFRDYGSHQQPIGNTPQIANTDVYRVPSPIFRPPGSNIDDFLCDYSEYMPDWESCQTPTNKSCWLRNKITHEEITITSDYETRMLYGKVRPYTLVVEDGWWNADGQNFTEAKLINGTFPGPLIEACWGDTLEVTVINKMKYNGTSIHWHGLRQLNSMEMDGVNGVTQCPLAPGDQFTYKIHLTQYGTSWLHSHFSVQYADGVQAPLTIHGPTSDNYDHSIPPLMMSDWGHNSAFNAQFHAFDKHGPGQLLNNSLVLNGTGNVNKYTGNPKFNTTTIPDPTVIAFDLPENPVTGGARYLLRITNSAYESGLVFSIDNHTLQIVEVDFVPIVSNSTYNHTAPFVLVGIGQRYHVIVEALPACLPNKQGQTPAGCNFWVRTLLATGCASDISTPPGGAGYSEVGILRYNTSDHSEPKSKQWPHLDLRCRDPDYSKFTPAFSWGRIPPPSNGRQNQSGETFGIGFTPSGDGPYQLAVFSFVNTQTNADYNFQTTYGNPTFLNLGNAGGSWPNGWMVTPENYTDNDWVYFVITDNSHPIHLHGHDFAILHRESNKAYPDAGIDFSCDATNPEQKLDCDNPPRRDVIILPGWRNSTGSGGYTVIAFKTDNPGVWLMHCHIAFHASSGLAIQIMERQTDAYNLWPVGSPAVAEAQRICTNWNNWAYDCKNYWPGPKPVKDGKKHDTSSTTKTKYYWPACVNATMLQNDSGI